MIPDKAPPLETSKLVESRTKAAEPPPSVMVPVDEPVLILVNQAIEHLSDHGSEADLLRAIARFAIERDH